jgi:hypothetical protein
MSGRVCATQGCAGNDGTVHTFEGPAVCAACMRPLSPAPQRPAKRGR